MKHSKSNLYLMSKAQALKSPKKIDLQDTNGQHNKLKSPVHKNQYFTFNLLEKESHKRKTSIQGTNSDSKKLITSIKKNSICSDQNASNGLMSPIPSNSYRNSLIQMQNNSNSNLISKEPNTKKENQKQKNKNKNKNGNLNSNQINIKLNLNNEIINNNYFHNHSKEKNCSDYVLKEKDLQIAKLKKEIINKTKIIKKLQTSTNQNTQGQNNYVNSTDKNTHLITSKSTLGKNFMNNFLNKPLNTNSNKNEIKTIQSYKYNKGPSVGGNYIYNSKSNTNLGCLQPNSFITSQPNAKINIIKNNNNSNFNVSSTPKNTTISNGNSIYLVNNSHNNNIDISHNNNVNNNAPSNKKKTNNKSSFCAYNSNNVRHNFLANSPNFNYILQSHFSHNSNNSNHFPMQSAKTSRIISPKKNSENKKITLTNRNDNSLAYCRSGPSSPNNTNNSINKKGKNTIKVNKTKKLFSCLEKNYLDFDNVKNNYKIMEDEFKKKMRLDKGKKSLSLVYSNNFQINKNLNLLTNISNLNCNNKNIKSDNNINSSKISSVEKFNNMCQSLKERTKNILGKYLVAIQNATSFMNNDTDAYNSIRVNEVNTNINDFNENSLCNVGNVRINFPNKNEVEQKNSEETNDIINLDD